jgi:hypothetical protein
MQPNDIIILFFVITLLFLGKRGGPEPDHNHALAVGLVRQKEFQQSSCSKYALV